MTQKKKLVWKLKDLPTGDELASLVEQKVLTPAEAREIILSEEKVDSNALKAKEEEIKFLRDLVDTLARRHNGWTTIYHEYERLTPRYPVWYGAYQPLMQTYGKTFGPTVTLTSGSTGIASGTMTNAINTVQSYSNNTNLKGLSSLN